MYLVDEYIIKSMKILITGGHHSSALPVIKKLKKEHKDAQMYWVGHKHSLKGDKRSTLEYIEITELGIPFYNLHAGKFYKTYDPIRLLKIPFGFLQSMFILLKVRPNIILSFGGYLAVPIVLVGKLFGIKSLTHEQTLVTGYANKLISKYANKVLISWPDSAKYFPEDKVVYTGIPLREEIFQPGKDTLELNTKLPTIYITGGKTGSHNVNVLVSEVLDDLLTVCNVIHQCGDNSNFNDFEMLNDKYKKLIDKPGKYIIKKFIMEGEIGEVFDKSSLIISRSGAHIISVIISLEKPSLLIPISWVSHNEQVKNAELVKEYGLAEVLEEEGLTPQHLLNKIRDMLSHIKDYKIKDKELKRELLKDSASLIVDEIFNLYKTEK